MNFQTYLSVLSVQGLRVQEYGIALNSYIACLTDQTYYLSCLQVISSLVGTFMTPLPFRATPRDLPTLPHKVNNAE